MTEVFSRCNSGHYFVGERCPFDGWTSSAAIDIARATTALRATGSPPSIEGLRAVGAHEDSIARCIIIEFGSDRSSFDAFLIGEYMKGSDRVSWTDFDADHL